MPGGGSPTQGRSAVSASLISPTSHPENAPDIPYPHKSSDGHAGIAVHPGASTLGRSGEQHSAISNAASLGVPDSHQGTFPDHNLYNPDQFDDAPYVPPRVTQAELQTFSAPDPAVGNVYPPLNHDIQHQYLYGGGISPSDSRHSVGSHWSNSSSSASSQGFSHSYLVGPPYAQISLPPRPASYSHHFPAYHGYHRPVLAHQPLNPDGSYYSNPLQSYSLDGLLSPEIFDEAIISQVPNYLATSSQGTPASSSISATNQLPSVSTFSVSLTPVTVNTQSAFGDPGPYLRQQLGLSAHAPVSLYSLPDPPPGEKPSTPLPMLVKLAIYGSPKKQLTLQEIYIELEKRFQWFREHKNEKAWKNSIRHNLSLNKVFQRVPRPITEPGKGNYWQLDMSQGEGYKRTRKRRPKNKLMVSEEEDEGSEMDEDLQSHSDPSQHAGLGLSSVSPVEDASIDPELRDEGHVIGEGHTRSATRRTGGGSPYPSHSPRYQQGPLPVVAEQDGSAPGQPPVRFGQPSFGQSSFTTYPQTRPMPVASSSFAAMSSSPVIMVPSMSTVAHPQPQHAASRGATAHIFQPPPRAGIEYVDAGGLPAARRVKTYPESQEDSAHSSSDSSSPRSSRTQNSVRSEC